MTTIVIVLAPESTPARTGVVLEDVRRALAARTENGEVRPMHPGARSAGLDRFFEVDVPAEVAPLVVGDLLHVPGVDGAYVKPADEAP
jgi:hypothetical protein